MRAYFQRRKERHIKLMQNETPKSREARLGRQRSQAKKQLPGKKGPLVFYWEKIGEFDIRIRTLLTRASAGFSWTTWSNKERVYDSFKNQYHPWQETLRRGQSTHKHTHMRKLIAASAA
jgi:hypothetical protein